MLWALCNQLEVLENEAVHGADGGSSQRDVGDCSMTHHTVTVQGCRRRTRNENARKATPTDKLDVEEAANDDGA